MARENKEKPGQIRCSKRISLMPLKPGIKEGSSSSDLKEKNERTEEAEEEKKTPKRVALLSRKQTTTSRFDIDNIMLPFASSTHGGAASVIVRHRRCLIETPKWRLAEMNAATQATAAAGDDDSEEDTSDQAYADRHRLAELRWRFRMAVRRCE